MGSGTRATAGGTRVGAGRRRSGRVQYAAVRGLPHNRRHARAGHGRPEPHRCRRAVGARRPHGIQRPVRPRRLDHERAVAQTGRADAAHRAVRARHPCDRRLSREPQVVTALRDPASDEVLEETWADAPGIPGFFTTVDHKRIGIRYIVTAFFFFFSAGLLALFMRAQLAEPNAHVLSAETFNEFFTMHGTSMIFLFNTPVLAGFGNYLLPLEIGSRDMAFPRLNAFSYWIFLLAGVFLYSSFLVGHPPDGGWFAYTPLTGKAFSPGTNLDFWGLGVVFVGISTTAGAVNFIVTTFKMRAPGLTLNRLPIYVWSMLVFSFMVIFAVPAVTVAAGLLELDRIFGTQFFNPAHGGSALLYQHLFWFWGHPEVYILFIPA